MTFLNLNYYRY